MSEELFADMVGSVSITGGVVRIDLMALDPSKPDAKGKPTAVVRQRIVMPADGFVGLANATARAMARMEKLGLVKRNEAAPAKAGDKSGDA